MLLLANARGREWNESSLQEVQRDGWSVERNWWTQSASKTRRLPDWDYVPGKGQCWAGGIPSWEIVRGQRGRKTKYRNWDLVIYFLSESKIVRQWEDCCVIWANSLLKHNCLHKQWNVKANYRWKVTCRCNFRIMGSHFSHVPHLPWLAPHTPHWLWRIRVHLPESCELWLERADTERGPPSSWVRLSIKIGQHSPIILPRKIPCFNIERWYNHHFKQQWLIQTS